MLYTLVIYTAAWILTMLVVIPFVYRGKKKDWVAINLIAFGVPFVLWAIYWMAGLGKMLLFGEPVLW